MPYAGQSAGKTGHDDLLRNPEIDRFLSACDHMREPSQEELGSIAAGFAPAPTGEGHPLPAVVVASDGSRYEASLSRLYPSTRVGYVKVSSLGVEVDAYIRLAGDASRLLDPFAVNRLQENATALSLALPSTNLRYGDGETVADGFRCRLDEVFRGEATRTGRRRERLIDTLYALAIRSEKNGRVLEDGRPAVAVRACPRCRLEPKGGFVVPADAASVTCPGEAGRPCGAVIYATDALRLHEAFTDLGSNEETLTRVMNAVEHILLAHYIRVAADDNLAGLSEVCFMLDGPLALFGMPAWLSRPMLRLIDEVRERQRAVGLRPFLLIGLQKQGQLAEHLGLIGRYLAPNTVLAVSDDYRGRYIKQTDPSANFGDETYYGQDFIFHTERCNTFAVELPYPWAEKRLGGGPPPGPERAFKAAKADLTNYPDLGRALDVVRLFESDLFRGSIVPVLLAHRHASISLVPGGQVLDIASILRFGGSGGGQPRSRQPPRP
jgi:hypothetical protein